MISPDALIHDFMASPVGLQERSNATTMANDVLNSSTMPAYHSGYFVGASIKAYCPQYAPKVNGS